MTGPTIRLNQPSRPVTAASAVAAGVGSPRIARRTFGRRAGIPLVGLLFAVFFVIGVAQVIASGGVGGMGLWPVGVLLAGALLAQRAWVNGDLWGGSRGMLLWGGLTWMLATEQVFPWAILLIPIWLILRLRKHVTY